MKKITIILSYLSVLFLLSNTPVKASLRRKNPESNATKYNDKNVPATINNNDLLATILENAQKVVEYIKNNTHNIAETKKTINALTNAETTFCESAQMPTLQNICSMIQEHTQGLKKEFESFSAHKKPLAKYNPTKAEQHLMALSIAVKNATKKLSESLVTQKSQEIGDAIAKTENIIAEAQKKINVAYLQIADGTITSAEGGKTIGQEKHAIATAQKALQEITDKTINEVINNDANTSYLNQFATAAYNFGASALSPLKSGYGYTNQEKEIAQAILKELNYQIKIGTDNFKTAIKNPRLSQKEKTNLTNTYQKNMQLLNDEIYQQQIITGEVMSFKRKLFWGTIGAAAAIGGAHVAQKYLEPYITEMDTQTSEEIRNKLKNNGAKEIDPNEFFNDTTPPKAPSNGPTTPLKAASNALKKVADALIDPLAGILPETQNLENRDNPRQPELPHPWDRNKTETPGGVGDNPNNRRIADAPTTPKEPYNEGHPWSRKGTLDSPGNELPTDNPNNVTFPEKPTKLNKLPEITQQPNEPNNPSSLNNQGEKEIKKYEAVTGRTLNRQEKQSPIDGNLPETTPEATQGKANETSKSTVDDLGNLKTDSPSDGN